MSTEYERISVTIPKTTLKEFRDYCARNAINMSGRITKLIEKDIQLNNGDNHLKT